jgi:hypothetical protein
VSIQRWQRGPSVNSYAVDQRALQLTQVGLLKEDTALA